MVPAVLQDTQVAVASSHSSLPKLHRLRIPIVEVPQSTMNCWWTRRSWTCSCSAPWPWRSSLLNQILRWINLTKIYSARCKTRNDSCVPLYHLLFRPASTHRHSMRHHQWRTIISCSLNTPQKDDTWFLNGLLTLHNYIPMIASWEEIKILDS